MSEPDNYLDEILSKYDIRHPKPSISRNTAKKMLKRDIEDFYRNKIQQEQLALLQRLKKQPVELSDSGTNVWAVPLEVINQEEERIRGK